MTEGTGVYIDGVYLDSVQQVDLSSGVSIDELDLVDSSDNIVVTGSNKGTDIQLSFTLIPERGDNELVEEKRDNVKSLVSQDASSNSISYNDIEGFLSIESVNVPESSNSPIRQGTIRGKFLPWPKNYSEKDIKFDLSSASFFEGELNGNLILPIEISASDLFADLSSSAKVDVLRSISGSTISSLDIPDAPAGLQKSVSTSVDGNLSASDIPLNTQKTIAASVGGNLRFDKSQTYGEEYGSSYSGEGVVLDTAIPVSTSINSSFSFTSSDIILLTDAAGDLSLSLNQSAAIARKRGLSSSISGTLTSTTSSLDIAGYGYEYGTSYGQ